MREPDAPLREPPVSAVRASWTEEPYWRRAPRNLAIAAAAGAFMAVVGAFGVMADAALWRRLAYWVPVMVAGALLGGVIASATLRVPRARASAWTQGALITLGMTAPSSLFIWIYTSWFLGTPPNPRLLPTFFFTVLVVSAAMTAIMILVNRPGAVTKGAPANAPRPVRFLERLPPKLRGAALYAVEAEDHYLRLHTSKGQDLILMRLADAITELDGLEGAQTHRSWWVAKGAVQDVKRSEGKVALVLPNGATAPVSRPNVRPLREAGWL